MRIATQIAAASSPVMAPPSGPCPAPIEARRRADPIDDLPCWARNAEARQLLARIAEQRPDRTKPLTETMTGATASFGYRGREAARLRQLFDPFIIDRIDWAYKAGFDTPLFHKRRKAVFAYIDDHGPDALIAKVLGDPAGQWAHAA